MAKQRGIFRLSGKIDDKIFYKSNEAYYVKKASKKDYNLSAASQRSGADFGTCSSAGRLIRNGFDSIIIKAGNDKPDSRLNSCLIKIINSCSNDSKGSRRLVDGDLSLLKGFEFNSNTHLINLLNFNPVWELSVPDKISFKLPEMAVKDAFRSPDTASFVVLKFTCCILDFDGKSESHKGPDDLVLPLDDTILPPCSLEIPIEDAEGKVLLSGMGVHFLESFKNKIWNRKWYAGKIMDAVLIRDGKIVPFQYPEKVAVAEKAAEKVQQIFWKFG